MQDVQLDLDEFVKLYKRKSGILIDVRSTLEYKKAHIPSALSLPLLDDEHRKIIGTIYKQVGREAAVMKGFELVGPLFHELIKTAIDLSPQKEVFIYCWRGGMRSNIMSWLLRLSGFKVYLLKDGYKSFRHWALAQLQENLDLRVLGGKTGSGKTEMLQLLSGRNEQIIDLEKLANHKGSAYGSLGHDDQPSQEYFENLLAAEISLMDKNRRIWIENESRAIGKIRVPDLLFDAIGTAPVIEMEVDNNTRKERILKEYGNFPVNELIEKTNQLKKRLGGQNLKNAVQYLEEGNLNQWLDIVLSYYDKGYAKFSENRMPVSSKTIIVNWKESAVAVQKIINVTD